MWRKLTYVVIADMCKRLTELNVLVCCLSHVRKRTIYDGLEDHGRVSCTPVELSSLCHIGVENFRRWKFFVCLIFVVVGHRRNIFNNENFPIYGIMFWMWWCNLITHWNNFQFLQGTTDTRFHGDKLHAVKLTDTFWWMCCPVAVKTSCCCQ